MLPKDLSVQLIYLKSFRQNKDSDIRTVIQKAACMAGQHVPLEQNKTFLQGDKKIMNKYDGLLKNCTRNQTFQNDVTKVALTITTPISSRSWQSHVKVKAALGVPCNILVWF